MEYQYFPRVELLNYKKKTEKKLTDFVIAATIGGAMIPGMVLSMLLIPIMTPEYLAANKGNKTHRFTGY